MRLEFVEIDRERTTLGTLSLHRYVADSGETGYEIRIDGQFLMASHGSCGETLMARLAHERLVEPPDRLTVLVGGLGAGHTLRAALDLPAAAEVDVIEISGRVVQWNRSYFRPVHGGALDDPRVTIHVAELTHYLAGCPERYDLLLLDVDNGPGWLAAADNARLYEPAGLRRCRQVLRPGGVLALWSPQPNEPLLAAVRDEFGHAEAVATAPLSPESDGPGDTVVLAVRPS